MHAPTTPFLLPLLAEDRLDDLRRTPDTPGADARCHTDLADRSAADGSHHKR